MLFYALSLFFIWIGARELLNGKPKDGMSLGYMAVCLGLAAAAFWQPFKYELLERRLTAVTYELADFKPADFQCQSLWQSIFDSTQLRWAGYAYVETGEVVFKAGWCDNLKRYLADPAGANREERFGLMLLVHEAMHVRGERNEQQTECQAIQRLYRTGLMMEVPEPLLREHALAYYLEEYPRHPYYSPNCRPGRKGWDEQLRDSTWQFLPADYAARMQASRKRRRVY